jgi:hypothetical protein
VGGPSRHQAAHDPQEGTRADTLACFLYLEALASLFAETDDSIAEFEADKKGQARK